MNKEQQKLNCRCNQCLTLILITVRKCNRGRNNTAANTKGRKNKYEKKFCLYSTAQFSGQAPAPAVYVAAVSTEQINYTEKTQFDDGSYRHTHNWFPTKERYQSADLSCVQLASNDPDSALNWRPAAVGTDTNTQDNSSTWTFYGMKPRAGSGGWKK